MTDEPGDVQKTEHVQRSSINRLDVFRCRGCSRFYNVKVPTEAAEHAPHQRSVPA